MKKEYIYPIAFLFATSLYADQSSVTLYKTEDNKTSLGQVQFQDTEYGLLITPNLTGLPPGLHGLHLHEKGDCGNQGMAAGGHYDPKNTKSHQGPYGKGHLGDLPVLSVDVNGAATTPTLAPRLSVADLKNLSLMIHSGGDNYSDTPPLGGGGARMACGVIYP